MCLYFCTGSTGKYDVIADKYGYSNRYFKEIYNASPETLRQAGFEIVSKGDAGSIFVKYGGKVTGGVR